MFTAAGLAECVEATKGAKSPKFFERIAKGKDAANAKLGNIIFRDSR